MPANFNPAGRVIAFTPMAGAEAFITINGVTLNLSNFEPTISSNPIDVTNFNSAADGNGMVHEEFLLSVVGSQFVISGPRDRSAIGYNPKVGDSGSGSIGWRAGFGFSFNFNVISLGGGSEVKSEAKFTCTIKINGLLTYVGP